MYLRLPVSESQIVHIVSFLKNSPDVSFIDVSEYSDFLVRLHSTDWQEASVIDSMYTSNVHDKTILYKFILSIVTDNPFIFKILGVFATADTYYEEFMFKIVKYIVYIFYYFKPACLC